MYIYRRYIHRMIGDWQSGDCTNFDLYAILSLLWTLTLSILYLIAKDYLLFAFKLLRILALIVPGYIHKSYIRYKVHSALDQRHYLGDLHVYKLGDVHSEILFFLNFDVFSLFFL